MKHLGLVRVGAAVPTIKVANVEYNKKQILTMIKDGEKNKAGCLLFPELALTGYSCGDLFFQEHLYQQQLVALNEICTATKRLNVCVIVGCYLRGANNLYNCAAIIQRGQIKGFVPKAFVPKAKGFNENRWFTSAITSDLYEIKLFGEEIPIVAATFTDETSGLCIGLEIGSELLLPVSPGAQMALNGAHIIFNPSAINDTAGSADYRKKLITAESAKCNCAYVYTSAGVTESTTDLVFGGQSLIVENGTLLYENDCFLRENQILYGDVDFQEIQFEQSQSPDVSDGGGRYGGFIGNCSLAPIRLLTKSDKLLRTYNKHPFVPETATDLDACCSDVFQIQAAGLAKRLAHTKSKKSILGISGGLDSTLALLVCMYTHQLLGRSTKDILAVTMPGFGTTKETHNNAMVLMKLLGVDIREIPIQNAVLQHFRDIGHDANDYSVTYENAQARERTQILMDLANKEGGLVIGTGDLSELALGWCTYNGDHMSMYGVNSGVPKTLIPHVIKWVIEQKLSGSNEDSSFSTDNALLKKTLQSVLETPISPELLPSNDKGGITQRTEDVIGPYDLNDFFLYHTLQHGMPPEKLSFVACFAFKGNYDEKTIRKWLKVFYQRLFSQQFKRSCMPDGPKVVSIGLSPRGEWQMPSDADVESWLRDLK